MQSQMQTAEAINQSTQPNFPVCEHLQSAVRQAAAPRLLTRWARYEDEIRAAQRLRYQVFAQEMGARIACKTPGVDEDIFDAFCEHLLVIDEERQIVVGTYRLLTPVQAKRVGGLYSDTEFDLLRLRPLRSKMVELGRSCVHPEYRTGGVIMTLWAALGKFMQANDLDTMVGCASIGMQDGGHTAASLWASLREKHLAPIEHHVTPRLALPLESLRSDLEVEAPPLIKGYLKLGAKILGAPAWDPDFNSADLPLMMRLQELHPRYRKHFLA